MKIINVLVVDDEQDFRETLVKRMRKRNFSVRGAKDGQEALEMMQESPADIVILDIRMPRMNGLQTLQALTQSHPSTKVILLTGHACAETAHYGLLHGAYDYLLKPVTLDQIMTKITECLQTKSDAFARHH